MANIGILHTQGGWPKDVDVTDVEHTIRYRKKIEKDEEYARSVKSLGDVIRFVLNYRLWSIASSRTMLLTFMKSTLQKCRKLA